MLQTFKKVKEKCLNAVVINWHTIKSIQSESYGFREFNYLVISIIRDSRFLVIIISSHKTLENTLINLRFGENSFKPRICSDFKRQCSPKINICYKNVSFLVVKQFLN